jgi:hypothetical protein
MVVSSKVIRDNLVSFAEVQYDSSKLLSLLDTFESGSAASKSDD